MANSGSFNPILFLQDAVAELKKVHRPTRQETMQTALSVVAMIMMFAVFLGFADFVVGLVMKRILT